MYRSRLETLIRSRSRRLRSRVPVVYRIRILESNPARYLDFFDWILFPFQPDPDYPNEIECVHAKNLDME